MRDRKPPQPVHLRDYRPPTWLAPKVTLRFELGEEETHVESTVLYEFNVDSGHSGSASPPLVLDGEELELVAIAMDGRHLDEGEYELKDGQLVVKTKRARFELYIQTKIYPQKNTALEGLYKSGGTFCTQMEAEGFRRVTFFQDRPDVMSVYRTTIVADRDKYPALLSNGTIESDVKVGDKEREVTWVDPHKKPCYLFALVAGDLRAVDGSFRTMSGKDVTLRFWVDPGSEGRVAYALEALKRAMRWDEEAYGREYDLDIFQVVAIRDFNMGAMENKSLNIFNEALVLADERSATDADFARIEGVIGHEYFHNWSGNRITCRDWFQLSLKEGFTVLRDQQFSAAMGSEVVQRIQDVQRLRQAQFSEDAGPMAHPVRPKSYIKIDNFYTATIYEKGAEVIRMMHTLLGEKAFRAGTDLYFERHDGQAVRTEDFLAALQEGAKQAGSPVDLSDFQRWYDQPGTPELTAKGAYDSDKKTYALELSQKLIDPRPAHKGERLSPVPIPVRTGLVAKSGKSLPLKASKGELQGDVLLLSEESQTWEFQDVGEPAVPSLLRGFSAPVKLRLGETGSSAAHRDSSDIDLALAKHDSDAFNRWEGAQRLGVKALLKLAEQMHTKGELTEEDVQNAGLDALLSVFEKAHNTCFEADADWLFAAELLALPSEMDVLLAQETLTPVAVHASREWLKRTLGEKLETQWEALRSKIPAPEAGDHSGKAKGARALRNLALAYRLSTGNAKARQPAFAAMQEAQTMTEELGAFAALYHTLPSTPDNGSDARDYREEAKALFKDRWKDDPLVMNKWFAVLASSPVGGAAQTVMELQKDPCFDAKNPNNLRSLYGAFSRNLSHFHAKDGSGYALMTEAIANIDAYNPIIAGRLAETFQLYKRLDASQSALAKAQLERLKTKQLSENTFEVVTKLLE